MARYVVAGVTGRVGSVVARELVGCGFTPSVIVRSEHARANWAGRGCDPLVCSLDDEAFLTGALNGADGFFVVLPENVQPDDFHGARRRLAGRIAAAVAASGVPHVVMQSAVAGSVAERNGPGQDLYYFEQRLRETGARITVLRSAYFQDNIEGMLVPAGQNGIYPHFMPSDDAAMPMIAIHDAGRIAAAALVAPPAATETVLVLGPAYSPRDLASKLGAAIHKDLKLVAIPPENHVGALMGTGMPQQLAEAVAEMLDAFSQGRIPFIADRQVAGTTPIDDVILGIVRETRARR